MMAVWATASALSDPTILPGPREVCRALWAVLSTGTLARAVATSVVRLAIGYAVSLVGGVTLGVFFARVGWLRDAFGPVVLGLQALPSVCWLPLALLCFGLSDLAIETVVVLGSLLSVTLATESAVKTIPTVWLRAARTMGAHGFTLWRRVVLPAALPGIVSGARVGWTFAWRSLLAAELLFVSGGLGQLLALGRELNDMALVLAVMAVIVALGVFTDRCLFAVIEDRVQRSRGLDRG